MAYCYAARLYRRFDAVYTLNKSLQSKLASLDVGQVDILPLGVDLDLFNPQHREMELRRQIGVAPDAPLLVYAGRIDEEKRAQTVLDAFELLPKELNAHLLFLGIGKSMAELQEQAAGQNVSFLGYESDRDRLGRLLASSDIYVSGMPVETFGISVIEAQAAGLPIVGVESGAMPERVPSGTGLLGPVDDAQAMAANIQTVWKDGAPAIGKVGRDLVESKFSWQRSFETLFQDIYPRALAARETA
jgi:alpha-1,6-mannosyltransferase